MVSSSIYPFFLSVCLSGFFVSLVVFFKSGLLFFVYVHVVFLLFGLFLWGKDIYMEGCSGYHNFLVNKGFKFGFIIFICTEVMFFFCIFWVFLDKVGLGSVLWWPSSAGYLNFLGFPLLGTIFLLSSGLFSTWGHSRFVSGRDCCFFIFLTLVLGFLFLCIQFYEYTHLFFNMSDGWCGSMFYFLTGFHGFHVIFGLVLMVVCFFRFFFCFMGASSYFFEGSVIYWHFVDVVWLFVYLLLYVFSSWSLLLEFYVWVMSVCVLSCLSLSFMNMNFVNSGVWQFIFFFLMSFLSLGCGLLFSFFLLCCVFWGFCSLCWGGGFLFFDSYVYVVMVYMSLFIFGLILMVCMDGVLVFVSEVLIFVCLFFFFSVNMLMLYVFFELSIIPILVMILGYGSQVEKVGASYYLGFYAIMCSSPFLYVYFCSNYLLVYAYYDFVVSWEMIVFLSLCFMVKFPVYFLHLWLPKAHVEAPTVGSMLLAGLLLKLGTVGFLRLLFSYNYVCVFMWLLVALVGMVFCSFLCLLQSDVKSLVAYSSVVHMSFVFLVLLVMVMSSKLSGVLMMLSHGYVSVLMFCLVGEFYHVFGTRVIGYYSGFMISSIFISCVSIMIFLCNGGLPPSLSFVSEFLGFVGVFWVLKGLVIFLFLYFFVAFYYTFFILTSSLMGGRYLYFFCWVGLYMCCGLLLMFNFFWIGVFC